MQFFVSKIDKNLETHLIQAEEDQKNFHSFMKNQ